MVESVNFVFVTQRLTEYYDTNSEFFFVFFVFIYSSHPKIFQKERKHIMQIYNT